MADKKDGITLIVNPIDKSAPGSWYAIRTLTHFAAEAERGNLSVVDLDEFMQTIEDHVAAPDGGDVRELLKSVSFDDMIELSRAIVGGDDDSGEAGDAS